MIEVGEYIRTEDGIFKITERDIGERIVFVKGDKGISYNYPKGEFFKYKHSKNKVDLLEKGDWIQVGEDEKLVRILDITGEYVRTTETTHNKHWLSKNIKLILTKELSEYYCYKVKEET